MEMKKEARIIGIDDSPFNKFEKGKPVLVVGTIFRGGNFIDGVVSTRVKIDGTDATKKLVSLINHTKFKPQLQAIFLKGIALAGFNVIDIKELSRKTKLSVIVVMRDYPDFEKIRKALRNVSNGSKRFELIKKAGKIQKVEIKHRGVYNIIYIQFTGLSLAKAREFLEISATHSLIPEPLRVAHIIASGVINGESRGKA